MARVEDMHLKIPTFVSYFVHGLSLLKSQAGWLIPAP